MLSEMADKPTKFGTILRLGPLLIILGIGKIIGSKTGEPKVVTKRDSSLSF
jgi:hypothetical protein